MGHCQHVRRINSIGINRIAGDTWGTTVFGPQPFLGQRFVEPTGASPQKSVASRSLTFSSPSASSSDQSSSLFQVVFGSDTIGASRSVWTHHGPTANFGKNGMCKKCLILLVGAPGFEPGTPSPPDWCANRAALRSDRAKIIDAVGLTRNIAS